MYLCVRAGEELSLVLTMWTRPGKYLRALFVHPKPALSCPG